MKIDNSLDTFYKSFENNEINHQKNKVSSDDPTVIRGDS